MSCVQKKGSYCENKNKKKSGERGQERCVQRMEVIVVKIQKKLGGGGWGGGGGGGGGLKEDKMRMKK